MLIYNVLNYAGLFYFSKMQVVSYTLSQVLFQLALCFLGECVARSQPSLLLATD